MLEKRSQSLDHLLEETRRFQPKLSRTGHLESSEEYQRLYQRSIHDAESFWLERAESLDWFKKPSIALQYHWDSAHSKIEHTWFRDGKINVSFNCLDRHLVTENRNKTAIIWQGDRNEETQFFTYQELYEQVCRFANLLKMRGISKGDRVCLYLPMIPELAIAMLACARMGAIHSIVFGGFSAEALSHRIDDAGCKLLVTSNVAVRGGKQIFLKAIADEAAIHCPSIEQIIVVKRNETACEMMDGRDVWYHEEMELASSTYCPPEELDSTDPLFILYTSGSTGKPKGVVHGQGGYLLHASLSHKLIFNIHDDDIYWCTADIGWITGHSYGIYGPLANGATTLLWPGIMQTTWGDHQRFVNTYFKTFPNVYFTGDGCRKDREGDLWLLGRIDDVVNISGHRIGTAEVESALVSHEAVAEAAVVPIPHVIKGQGLYAFVTLLTDVTPSKELKISLEKHVRTEIGPIAVPDKIQFTHALPKTRSGKIIRRVLRKIAENQRDELGDLSTLADPHIIESLLSQVVE